MWGDWEEALAPVLVKTPTSPETGRRQSQSSSPATPTSASSDPDPTPYYVPGSPIGEPLYVEIRIPLPPIPPAYQHSPISPTETSPSSWFRDRSHSLVAASPFYRERGRSRSIGNSFGQSLGQSLGQSFGGSHDEVPPPLPPRRSEDIQTTEDVRAPHFSLSDFGRGRKSRGRSRTLGALAVAPAVMMLNAELFTPDGTKVNQQV